MRKGPGRVARAFRFVTRLLAGPVLLVWPAQGGLLPDQPWDQTGTQAASHRSHQDDGRAQAGRLLIYSEGVSGPEWTGAATLKLLEAAAGETLTLGTARLEGRGDRTGRSAAGGDESSGLVRQRLLVDQRVPAGAYSFLLVIRSDTLVIPVNLELAADEAAVQVLRPITTHSGERGLPGRPALRAEQPVMPPIGSLTFVANEEGGYITVLHYPGGAVAGAIELGCGPRDLAYSPRFGRIFVIDERSALLVVIDARLGKVQQRVWLQPGDDPIRLAVSEERGLLYVLNRGSSTLVALDLDNLQEISRAAVESQPRGLALDPVRGYLLVSGGVSDEIQMFDSTLRSMVRRTVVGPSPGEVVVDGATSRIFVASAVQPQLTVLDLEGGNVMARMRLCAAATELVYAPRERRLCASLPGCGQISILAPEWEIEVDALRSPGAPGRLSIGPDGRQLLAALPEEDRVVAYNLQSGEVLGVYEVGRRPRAVIVPR